MDDIDSAETDTKVTKTMDNTASVEKEIEYSKTAAVGEIPKNDSEENSEDSQPPLNYEYVYLDSCMDNMDTETDAVDQLIDPKTGYIAGQNEILETEEQKIDDQVKDCHDKVESGNNEMKTKVMIESSIDNVSSDDLNIDKSIATVLEDGEYVEEKSDPVNVEIQHIFDKGDFAGNTESIKRPTVHNELKLHGIVSVEDLVENHKDKQIEAETLERKPVNSNYNEVKDSIQRRQSLNSDEKMHSGVHANQSSSRNVVNVNKTAEANDRENNNVSSSSINRQSLSLNLQCPSPEDDGRGVSPEIVCLTHLSPTALYGKEQPGVPRLLSKYDSLSRPPSLNTPDPVVYGESDSSSCPTPFMYTSSNCMPNYGQNLYTSNGNQFMESNYAYVMPENPIPVNDQNYHLRGQKRKLSETDVNNNNNNRANSSLSDLDRVSPDLFPFSAKCPSIMGQMYHTQGRPPDVSTWTAVNSGPCKYGTGFGESCGQNYGNSLSRDPFLYGYQQQYSDCGYNSQMAGQFSSKPTCKVPPYMLNHTQTTDSYSAYSQTVEYDNSQFGSDYNFPITGTPFSNTMFEPGEQTRASCQYASNQSIDANNNMQFGNQNTFTSRACCRLDFSSPVNPEQYQYSAFPIPTFVSTHSYLSGLTKPEPLFPNSNPMITTHKRTATCTSTYSRPSSAMSTRSDNGASTPSIDLTQPSSDEEETLAEEDKEVNVDANNNLSNAQVTKASEAQMNIFYAQNHATEVEKYEIPPGARTVKDTEYKIENMIVPLSARSTKILCQVKDLASKTVKELIQTAEKKADSDGEQYASSSTQSATSPPPAHQNQKVTESFAAEFVKQRKTKSPISAFCAALDLSKPKKNEACRPILPYPNVQPAIPISSLLNINGPTLAYNGSMMVPYLQSLCASNSYLTSKTIADSYTAQKFVPVVQNRIPFTSTVTGSYTNTSQTLNIPNPATLMNFAPYATLPIQNLQYFPYIGAAATMPVNQIPTSGQSAPNINLSNIPLPLYQQLPQRLAEQGEQTVTSKTVTAENNSNTNKEAKKQLLCQRNIGMAAPGMTDITRTTGVNRMETRGRKKKCSAASIAPPPTTIPGYTATIQGCSITTQPSSKKYFLFYCNLHVC